MPEIVVRFLILSHLLLEGVWYVSIKICLIVIVVLFSSLFLHIPIRKWSIFLGTIFFRDDSVMFGEKNLEKLFYENALLSCFSIYWHVLNPVLFFLPTLVSSLQGRITFNIFLQRKFQTLLFVLILPRRKVLTVFLPWLNFKHVQIASNSCCRCALYWSISLQCEYFTGGGEWSLMNPNVFK